MARNIDIEKEKDKIVNFGSFEYSIQKMAAILMVEEKEIETLMKDHKSDFYFLYQKGLHTKDYVLDVKLFDMSRSGDLKALEEFNHRIKTRTRK